jgi:ribosome-associated heat shock protein Hsp15
VQSGKLRLNGNLISKPARTVSTGDVLTFPKMLETKVIEVRDLGTRRGPAREAQMLYRDLAPPQLKVAYSASPKGDHKPTAQERRALKKFKQDLENN